MTTLKDINLIREQFERAAEIYNRRCRRLVALYTAGRKVTDHMILFHTDMRRLTRIKKAKVPIKYIQYTRTAPIWFPKEWLDSFVLDVMRNGGAF